MKVVIAPDSLKECLSASRAARAIRRGVLTAAPEAEVVSVPMADGGEGTTEAIIEATGGEYRRASVADPLGRPVTATWGLCHGGKTAVVEMAQASGLERLAPHERDPMRTSTYGTGEMIAHALDAGAKEVIVGVGGSATVDGGTGMAEALGVRFFDSAGNAITGCCGGKLARIARIDPSGLDRRVGSTRFVVACDVTNPLVGPDGAARTYAPQKGADARQVEELERGLASLARVIERDLGAEVADMAGAGAAGGLAAGLVAFLGARICSGFGTVTRAVGLREKLVGADLLITAEGRLDWQSAFGKVVAGVAGLADQIGVPVLALAGSLGEGYRRVYKCGVRAALSIIDRPVGLAAAIAEAEPMLEATAESAVRLWLAGRGGRDG